MKMLCLYIIYPRNTWWLPIAISVHWRISHLKQAPHEPRKLTSGIPPIMINPEVSMMPRWMVSFSMGKSQSNSWITGRFLQSSLSQAPGNSQNQEFNSRSLDARKPCGEIDTFSIISEENQNPYRFGVTSSYMDNFWWFGTPAKKCVARIITPTIPTIPVMLRRELVLFTFIKLYQTLSMKTWHPSSCGSSCYTLSPLIPIHLSIIPIQWNQSYIYTLWLFHSSPWKPWSIEISWMYLLMAWWSPSSSPSQSVAARRRGAPWHEDQGVFSTKSPATPIQILGRSNSWDFWSYGFLQVF